MMLSLKVCRRI